eukprot:scaffold3379_cov143-Pinguiococcus_pyrenoidosus.AAC.1
MEARKGVSNVCTAFSSNCSVSRRRQSRTAVNLPSASELEEASLPHPDTLTWEKMRAGPVN